MNNKLDTLGLCRKSGKIIFGFDAVVGEMAKAGNKVAGVIITSDLSGKTKKEVEYYCNKHGKPIHAIEADMAQTEGVLGKKTGVMAILDEGLYNVLNKQR